MRYRRRGVVLVVSLLIVMTIVMLAVAATSLNRSLLPTADGGHMLAQKAADSGLEYAIQRLLEDPQWRGDSNTVTVDLPEVRVVESQGNVVGWLQTGRSLSQFRIRFNFQDGPGLADGLDDPEPAMWIDHPYLSINNAAEGANRLVPQGDGPDWSVVDPAEGDKEVPGGFVAVVVEGRAGPGLNPDGPDTGKIYSSRSEACFRLAADPNITTAALMAGGNIDIRVPLGGQVKVDAEGAEDDRVRPRLRSKGSIQVRDSDGNPADFIMGAQAEIGRDVNVAPGFVANVVGEAPTFHQENVGDGLDFYNLGWDDVEQADTDPASQDTIRIPGGTYIVWDDRSVHYYDMSYEDFQAYVAVPSNRNDPGVVLSPDMREIREPANYANHPGGLSKDTITHRFSGPLGERTRLHFDADTRITTSPSGVTDFTVAPRGGAAFSPDDRTGFNPDPDLYDNRAIMVMINDSIVSAPGDVRILCRLEGRSSTLTCEGNMMTTSPNGKMLEGGNTRGLDIYAMGDLSLSSYVNGQGNTPGRFGALTFNGTLYSWGNVTAIAGHPDVPSHEDTDKWQELTLTGTVVAYGAPPDTGEPGSAGSGQITLAGKNVTLEGKVDLANMLDLGQSDIPVQFERTFYGSY